MRKLCLVLLLLSSFFVHAQTTVFKKIAQRHDVYESSAWRGVDSFRWNYNTNAIITQQNALRTDVAGNWNDYFRYTYMINSNDKVDVQIRENWNGSAWVNSTRYSYDYDTSGNLLMLHYDVWNGSSWNTTGKIQYSGYNAQHKYNIEILFIWNGSAWEYLSKDLYQYYPNDYQPQFIEKYNWNGGSFTWDPVERFYLTFNMDSVSGRTRSVPFGGSWLQHSRQLYTYSTTPFLLTEYLYQTWDTTITPYAWANENRVTYTYTASGKMEKTQSEVYSGAWIFETRSQNIYNGSNELIEYYDEFYTFVWNNNTRKTFAYTAGNLTEEIRYNASGASWSEDKKLSYLYDANNLNTYRQIDTFNGAMFVPNSRDFYYYNSFSVHTNDLLALTLPHTLYPNPAHEQINLRFTSNEKMNVTIRVIDMTGKCRLLITQPVFEGDNQIQIPVERLASGNYFIRMTELQNGRSLNEKFQVTR